MTTRNWSFLAILSILWGGSFFFVELALRGLPVLTIVWARVAGAALLLGLWIWARGLGFPRGPGHWRALMVQGFLNNVVPFTLFVLAQDQIEGALAAIVNATTPLWTVLVAHFATSDERLTPAKILALALGFGGVLVMTGGEAGGTAWAILACLAAALSYGFAGVWGRRFKPMGLSPEQVAFGQVSCATLILLPIWLVLDQPWQLAAPPTISLAAMVGLISLSTALAYLIFFRILASAGATMLSLVTFLIPVSAIALGIGFLGEHLLPRHMIGFGLIVIGLLAIDGRLWKWAKS
jgi:drug/metabolite transporter (DMT)-like permease